jgi:hypothetical protein
MVVQQILQEALRIHIPNGVLYKRWIINQQLPKVLVHTEQRINPGEATLNMSCYWRREGTL